VLSETKGNSKENESEETTLELKISEENSITKATVTAFQQINYKILKLTAPDRLIIDIQDIRPGNLPPMVIVNFEVVSQVRVGWFNRNPDITRLVFDLNKRAFYRSYLSEDKKVLTVEIFTPKPGEEKFSCFRPWPRGKRAWRGGTNRFKGKRR